MLNPATVQGCGIIDSGFQRLTVLDVLFAYLFYSNILPCQESEKKCAAFCKKYLEEWVEVFITYIQSKAMVPCLEPILKRIKNQKLHTLCTIN
jgi:hypothetical protein